MKFCLIILIFSLTTHLLWAANGDLLTGASPASLALGGTGVANYTNSTDALSKNPALLVDINAQAGKSSAELSAQYFHQSATADVGTGAKDSQFTSQIAPSLAASYQITEKVAVGLGLLSIGGGIADYKGETALTELKNDFRLARLVAGGALKLSDQLSVGLSPFLTYGTFALNEGLSGTQSTRAPHSAIGFGVQVGATVKPIESLLIGASYTSKSSLTYKSVVNLDAFGPNFANPATAGLDDVTIEQPQEIAIGVSYAVLPELKLTLDYRNIGWSNAEAYKQFGWNNQNVFGFGAQYSLRQVVLRAGFNYGKSPVSSVSAENGVGLVDLQGHSLFARSVSEFNLVTFPGIAETHFCAGVGYDATNDLGIDAAFVYSPSSTVTRAGTFTGTPGYSFVATVSQWTLSAGAAYRF